jgi:hypothetical protein
LFQKRRLRKIIVRGHRVPQIPGSTSIDHFTFINSLGVEKFRAEAYEQDSSKMVPSIAHCSQKTHIDAHLLVMYSGLGFQFSLWALANNPTSLASSQNVSLSCQA